MPSMLDHLHGKSILFIISQSVTSVSVIEHLLTTTARAKFGELVGSNALIDGRAIAVIRWSNYAVMCTEAIIIGVGGDICPSVCSIVDYRGDRYDCRKYHEDA